MFRVEKPIQAPGFCAVQAGRSADPEGFIDTGNNLAGHMVDPHIYISIAAAREMGRRFAGLVDEADLIEAQEKIEELEALVQTQQDALAKQELRFDAIELLESENFRAKRAAVAS